MDAYIGEIRPFAGVFVPGRWALCNGQLLAIMGNTALFSILGTQYGGDGQSTFALPDLRGRFPMHYGHGPGLTPRSIGGKVGSETVALSEAQLPQHVHRVHSITDARATDANPAGKVFAAADVAQYAPGGGATMQALAPVGQGQGHSNLSPYLAINFIIALSGTFPQRA